jgi:hypothetical protein
VAPSYTSFLICLRTLRIDSYRTKISEFAGCRIFL